MAKNFIGAFIARVLPGPGVQNVAYIPPRQNPLFSPVGPGIPTSYNWQLLSGAVAFNKNLVVAGYSGVPTGDFETAAFPLSTADDVTQITAP